MNRIAPRIQAPQLSDLARQRIRQAVFDRLDRESLALPAESTVNSGVGRRALVVGMTAAAAILLIGMGVGLSWFGARSATSARGNVASSRVVTGESSTTVTVGPANLTAAAYSAFTVTEAATGAVQVILERGAVSCAVAHTEGGPPFVVVAADVRVEVVGTELMVARDRDLVRVQVRKGVVRVIGSGEATLVGAGQSWPAELAAEGAESVPSSSADPDAPVESTSHVDAERETSRAVSAPRRAASRTQRESGSKEAVAPPAAAAEKRPAVHDPRERYEAAARLELTRPKEALALYRALVADGGSWAANALFAQARLELELGRRKAARRLLESYLARYPRGANAEVARTLLDGLL